MLLQRKTNYHEPNASSRYRISATHYCSKEIAHSFTRTTLGVQSAAGGNLQTRI
jgi:hypothetical protein